MKNLTIFLSLTLGGSLFFTSCKNALEITPTEASKHVRLQTIQFTPGAEAYSSKRLITFNEKGEPIRSIAEQYSTADPNEVFKYNYKGELKERILFFGDNPDSYYVQGNNVFVLYTYNYDTKGRIISDTNHYIGGFAIGQNASLDANYLGASRSIMSYNDYTYDSKNRIISVKNTFAPTNYITITNYEYDNLGNLVGYSYDNKYNPIRLSKVLTHITNDFSVNNRIDSELTYTYNKYNLPTSVATSGYNLLNLFYGPGVADISYVKK